LSKLAVFALPVLMILLRRFWSTADWNVRSAVEVMFWGANGFICSSYGTVAFEYRLVSMLFLVPFLLVGRSILFPLTTELLTAASRMFGVLILLLAFRTESHVAGLDLLLGHGRADVPLLASLLMLTALSIRQARQPIIAAVSRRRTNDDVAPRVE
jgi:hypothetical protein